MAGMMIQVETLLFFGLGTALGGDIQGKQREIIHFQGSTVARETSVR